MLEMFLAVVTVATFGVAIAALYFQWIEKERSLTPVLKDFDIKDHGDYLAVRLEFLARNRFIMIESVSAPGFELALADPRRPSVELAVPTGGFAPYLDISIPICLGTINAAVLFFCIRSNCPGKVQIQLRISERSRRVRYQITALPATKTSTERYKITTI